MIPPCLTALVCPLCQTPFREEGRSWRCEQHHTFDKAREGYVNLYVGKGKRPKFMGDDKAMLQARRAFLEAGFYAPLATKIQEIVAAETKKARPTVIDAGCGEGYYLGKVAEQFGDGCFFGMDLAKEAARLAAKRYKMAQFLVADSKRPFPFRSGCADWLLNIFAPRNPAEFGRVVGENGRLLIVIPTDQHLATLRQTFSLLNIETDKVARIQTQLAPWFQIISEETVTFKLELTRDYLQQLIQMSPSARHWNQEQADQLASTSHFTTHAACRLLLLQRI